MTGTAHDNRPVVLWIHPGGLLPVSGGGAARTWALIEFLRAHGFRVELVTGDQGEHNVALEARVDRLWIEHRRGSRPAAARGWKDRAKSALKRAYRRLDPELRWLYRLNARAGRRVAPVDAGLFERNRRPRLERYAGQIAYTARPAAAVASYVWLAPALDHMPPGTLRILDTIDIQHERRDAARAAGGHLPHATCTPEEEARELNRADVLLAIQGEEAETLAALCPAREVIRAEHACTVPDYTPSPPESRELLYIGNLYDPNVLGLRALLDQVWPAVRARCPSATLTVCGRVSESVRRPPAGVTLAGRVPDLASYYQRAAVVLNPVPYGTGLKIKTVEGLAHGRCVVCSTAGAGGLGDPDTLPLMVADPETDMADRVLAVLENATLRHDYERRAWEYARDRYSPEAVYGPLLERLQRHVAD